MNNDEVWFQCVSCGRQTIVCLSNAVIMEHRCQLDIKLSDQEIQRYCQAHCRMFFGVEARRLCIDFERLKQMVRIVAVKKSYVNEVKAHCRRAGYRRIQVSVPKDGCDGYDYVTTINFLRIKHGVLFPMVFLPSLLICGVVSLIVLIVWLWPMQAIKSSSSVVVNLTSEKTLESQRLFTSLSAKNKKTLLLLKTIAMTCPHNISLLRISQQQNLLEIIGSAVRSREIFTWRDYLSTLPMFDSVTIKQLRGSHPLQFTLNLTPNFSKINQGQIKLNNIKFTNIKFINIQLIKWIKQSRLMLLRLQQTPQHQQKALITVEVQGRFQNLYYLLTMLIHQPVLWRIKSFQFDYAPADKSVSLQFSLEVYHGDLLR